MTPPLHCHPCSIEPVSTAGPPGTQEDRARAELGRRAAEGLTIVDGTLTCLHHAREQEQDRISKERGEQEHARLKLETERRWHGR